MPCLQSIEPSFLITMTYKSTSYQASSCLEKMGNHTLSDRKQRLRGKRIPSSDDLYFVSFKTILELFETFLS